MAAGGGQILHSLWEQYLLANSPKSHTQACQNLKRNPDFIASARVP
jgi:hypothetical protein